MFLVCNYIGSSFPDFLSIFSGYKPRLCIKIGVNLPKEIEFPQLYVRLDLQKLATSISFSFLFLVKSASVIRSKKIGAVLDQ